MVEMHSDTKHKMTMTMSKLQRTKVDSLIDLGFVSVTPWWAVEADSVHRNMG